MLGQPGGSKKKEEEEEEEEEQNDNQQEGMYSFFQEFLDEINE